MGQSRHSILCIFAFIILLSITGSQKAYAAQENIVEITSPGSSAIVSGVVPIRGTAIDPDFKEYELEFAPDPPIGDQWFSIQPPVAQQVREGTLGAWDTTFVDDGRYLIRLRVIRSDDTFIEDQVRIFVANATPTPTITLTPTLTLTPTIDIGATLTGPTPTPLIQQPPTRTPRPNRTPEGITATPQVIGSNQDQPFNPTRLRQAIRRGVIFTLAAFFFLGIYQIIRLAVRGGLRRAWWQFRYDILDRFRNK